MTAPSWQPDPTGRNQYRWWDGAAWTDHVSSNGQNGVDPLQPAAAPQPVVRQPVVQQPAAVQQPYAGAPTMVTPIPQTMSTGTPSAKKNPLKIIVPIAAVVAVGAVLFFVLGGGDDEGGGSSGLGVTEVELTEENVVGAVTLNLQRGDVIRVRLEVDDEDVHSNVIVAAEGDTADGFIEAFGVGIGNSEFSDFVSDVDELFTDADSVFSDHDMGDFRRATSLTEIYGSPGEVAADSIPILVDGTYSVVYGADDGEVLGSGRLIIERYTERIDDDVLDDFDELDDFFSDSDNADFFSDPAFFTDEEPFTPEG